MKAIDTDEGYIPNTMLTLLLQDRYINQWEYDFYLKSKSNYEKQYNITEKQQAILTKIRVKIDSWINTKIKT